jgi:malate dehydrogenase (oxaloacetate-decarboxylating)(NADP+)
MAGLCLRVEGPFAPVFIDGKKLIPGQGNNAYIFPGFGLDIVVSESRRVTNEMFLAAARALASEVSETDLAEGRIYPPLKRIRASVFNHRDRDPEGGL